MKKFAPIVMVALLAVAFTSCKKDYTCTCKDSAGTETAKYTFPKTTKKTAKSGCDTWHNAATISGGKCELN